MHTYEEDFSLSSLTVITTLYVASDTAAVSRNNNEEGIDLWRCGKHGGEEGKCG